MRRSTALERLRAETFDLLVVGGGITGAGVAFDASSRGMRVALVEQDDYAAGTSSKSSKLIHGGLRYLAHLEFGLVREALRERGILQQMVPHLVRPTPFLIPRYGKRRMLALRMGLDTYDVLAFGSGFPRHRKVEPSDVLRMAPALKPDPAGGLVYWDARTNDTRLTWTVARSAADRGAAVANRAEVVELLRSGPAIAGRGPTGRVAGAVVRDRESGEAFEVRARTVVNATGVWSDEVQALESEAHQAGIRPSKGVHIVVEASRLEVNSALLLPAPDGRYVFVIPWGDDRVVVGTTDEDYRGSLEEPRAARKEVDYLLDVLNRHLAEPLGFEDVVASFAGLRPLIQRPGEKTKDLSRRHRVVVGPSGLVTVTGGKLTTFRPMAADAVDAALEVGGFRSRPPSRTAELKLAGGDGTGTEEAVAAATRRTGLGADQARRLHARYGTLASEVVELVEREPALGEPLQPDLPTLRAEAAYAVECEQAAGPGDVLARRTWLRIMARDRGLGSLDWVVDRLAAAHGWSPERRTAEAAAYRADVEADLNAERA